MPREAASSSLATGSLRYDMDMKLHVMSDLHLDMQPDYGEAFVRENVRRVGDILVLAGDICSLAPHHEANTHRLFEQLAAIYDRIIYVPGNHDFWGTSLPEGDLALAHLEQSVDAVAVLRTGQPVTLLGQRFLGATMWYKDDPVNFMYERGFSDFRFVRGLKTNVYAENEAFTKFLLAEATPNDVIVTHHLPSSESTPLQFKNSKTNRFFVCDQREVIEQNKPKLWIHGHTHCRFDYKLGSTRIYCNPRGYDWEDTQAEWVADQIVEV